jgi:hypothetical protein
MHLEMMRTYPVAAPDAFEYMRRFKLWPEWAGLSQIRSTGSKWEKKGDIAHFVYQPFVPVAFAGEIELVESRPNKLVKGQFRMPGIDEATMTWMFMPVGDKAFTLKILIDTPELDTRFAKAMHNAMFHRRLFKTAMMRQLDGLDVIFAKGVPKATTRKPRKPAAKKTAA